MLASGPSVHVFDQNLLGQTGAQGDAGSTNPANQIGSTPDFFHDGILTKTHLPQALTGTGGTIQTPNPDLIPRSNLSQIYRRMIFQISLLLHIKSLERFPPGGKSTPGLDPAFPKIRQTSGTASNKQGPR
jgi:hypothetical protein